MPPPQRLATSCSPPSRSSPPPRSRRRLIRGARLPPRSRRDRFRPRPAPVAGGFRSRTATATASSPRMPAGVPVLPERSGSVTARSGDTQPDPQRAAPRHRRCRDAGHQRPARAPDRGRPDAAAPRRYPAAGVAERIVRQRHRPRDRLRRPAGRALPRLRRALERGRPAGQRRRELRRRGRLPGRRAADHRGLRPAVGLPAARRRDLLPGSVAALDRRLRRPRRQHRDELLPARQRRQRRLERRGDERTARQPGGGAPPRRAVAADLRRPRPGRRAAPVHGRHRPPAPRRRAPGTSAPGFSRPGDERARSTTLQSADAPVSVEPDLHPLPALRRSTSAERAEQRARTALVPLARAGDDHVLQPDDLHRLRGGLRGSGPARGADRDAGGRSLRLPLQHRQPVPRLAARLLERRRRADVRRAARARRSPTATTAGWRTSASTRRSTPRSANGMDGTEMHNLYPAQYHCAAQDFARAPAGRSAASSAPATPGWRRARRSSGAATRPSGGASTGLRRR